MATRLDFSLDKIRKALIVALSLFIVGFNIYTSLFGLFDTLLQRGTHLAVALVLIYLYKPTKLKSNTLSLVIDLVLIGMSVAHIIYSYANLESIYTRGGTYTQTEVVIGVALIIATLIAAYRMMGWTLPILGIIALTYCIWGNGISFLNLGFRDIPFGRIIFNMCYTGEGIFSQPLASVSSVVIPFLLFAEVLDATGARQLLMDFALVAFGSRRGGAAKVAVISSGLFGMVSGSAVANVVSTGTVTIPLMKKSGFQAKVAGAIEACASTGGMLAPPIMGAAAFVMAECLGVSYLGIIKMAIIPAILYYFAIFMYVEFKTMDKKASYTVDKSELAIVSMTKKQIFIKSFTVIIPIGVLLYCLDKYSTHRSVLMAIIVMLVVALFTKSTDGLKHPVEICKRTTSHILPVAMATALGGIMVGMINFTGLGFKISNLLIMLSGGKQLLLLFMAMIASIIFGMGLPPTACYILITLLVAPVMVEQGVPLNAAHLFAFYFAILAGVTPPVATSSYAAATIADRPPMEVGWAGFKILLILAFIPYAFVYYPDLLFLDGWTISGLISGIVTIVCTLILGSAAISGYLFWVKLSTVERLLIVAAELVVFSPQVPLVGNVVVFLLITIYYFLKGKRTKANPKYEQTLS